MTFKRSIIISVVIHTSLIAGIFVSSYKITVNFDLKQGVSSLALNISGNKEIQPKTDKREYKRYSELRVLISSAGFFDMANHDLSKEKRNYPKRREKNRRVPINTRETIGTLHNRATANSINFPPRYPYLARKLKYQGKVTLDIEVLPIGRVGDVKIAKSSGYAILDRSAVDAAKKWVFFEEGEIDLFGPVRIKKQIQFILRK